LPAVSILNVICKEAALMQLVFTSIWQLVFIVAATGYVVCRLLYTALEEDDVNKLQRYLCNVRMDRKTLLLLAAVHSARYHCIRVLMTDGCDPTLKVNGTSAVQCAIMKNDMKALLLLVDVDTKPVQVNSSCQRSWHDDQKPVDEALFVASGLGNVEAVNLLLDHGANPNCCFYYDDEFLVTCSTLVAACFAPLRHLASSDAMTNAETVVCALVSCRANVNRRCSTGMTPLHWAVKAGLVHSLTVLVKSGADVNAARANDGLTPLMMAVERDLTAVAALLSAGADVDAIDYARYTALCHAVKAGSLPIAEYLLQQGANPDGRDFISEIVPFITTTPLYLATSLGCRAMVVTLLKWGANLHQTVGPIPSRSTVFRVALCVNNFDLARVFLAAGVDHGSAFRIVCGQIDDMRIRLLPEQFSTLNTRIRMQRLEELLSELSQPQTLKQLCRMAIRRCTVDCKQLHKLPLPSALCAFLSLSDL